MFFKMLKKDLQMKKGLNVILFLFMAVASVLTVVSAIQVYTYLAGKERTYDICKSSDFYLIQSAYSDKGAIQTDKCEKWLDDNEKVSSYVREEVLLFPYFRIDFQEFDEEQISDFYEINHYVTKQTFEHDLSYTLDDECFYVNNGEIAISQNIHDLTGASIGDSVRFTSPMGNIYEFTVSQIFKDPLALNFQRYIISDEDYEILRKDSLDYMDAFSIQLKEGVLELEFYLEYIKAKVAIGHRDFAERVNDADDSYIIMFVVAVFMVLLSIFMILIIFMTIRFTLISAIKEEEKEIGMMKAIGVDSFRFRWLFAAKYVAFAVIGGLIGIVAGIPLARIMLKTFNKNTLVPDMFTLIIVAVIAVIGIIAVLLFFSMLAMRRMKKISVLDALHGENKGERFGKMSKLYLHRCNRLPICGYLAISDILNRFKRFAFLVVAYILGVAIIMLTTHLKNSVISEEFLKYDMIMQMDFYMDFGEEMAREYLAKTGSGEAMLDLVNQEMKDASIPARIDYCSVCFATADLADDSETIMTHFGGTMNPEDFCYREGGVAPKLANEIALSYFFATKHGLSLGDKVTMKVMEFDEKTLRNQLVKKDYIITAFFDVLEGGNPHAIVANGYDYVSDQEYYHRFVIDAPEHEKKQYLEMIEDLYGEECVKTREEFIQDNMAEFDIILSLVQYVLSTVSLLVMILLTALYSTVLFTEEIPTISMLKSVGFDNRSIRLWQILRMLILVFIAICVGNLVVNTAGVAFVNMLFGILGLTGFEFVIHPVLTYLIIPSVIIITVIMTLWIRLRSVDDIEIWKIREE